MRNIIIGIFTLLTLGAILAPQQVEAKVYTCTNGGGLGECSVEQKFTANGYFTGPTTAQVGETVRWNAYVGHIAENMAYPSGGLLALDLECAQAPQYCDDAQDITNNSEAIVANTLSNITGSGSDSFDLGPIGYIEIDTSSLAPGTYYIGYFRHLDPESVLSPGFTTSFERLTRSLTVTAVAVNGVCGTSSGTTAITAEPTTNPAACNPGTYFNSPVDTTSNWNWSCNGLNGGTNVTICSAPKSSAVPPTATLTVNGVESVTVTAGTDLTYAWNSTGGTSYSSFFTTDASCPGGPGPSTWDANTARGGYTSPADISQEGCSYEITYEVTNSAGTATDTITVNIVETYTLTTSISSGLGTITGPDISCPGDCSQSYSSGDLVTLFATPSSGYSFSNWSGACAGQTSSCSIQMDSNLSTAASFDALTSTYTLAVNSSGASAVTIIGSPSTYGGTTNYTKTSISSGTSITLTAPTIANGNNFSSWSGTGCSSVNRSISVSMTTNRTCTANYTTSLSEGPIGNHDGANNASCSTSGWAFDQNDTTTSIAVHFYMDGPAGSGSLMRGDVANVSRPDVNTAFGITGNHGFITTFDSSNTPPSIMSALQTGTHQIYVHAIDSSGGGPNPLITNTPKSLNCTPSTYTLAVNSSGASAVTIIGSPSTYGGTTDYTKTSIPSGISIVLTAPEIIGHTVHWSGIGCNNSGRQVTVNMNTDRTCTVHYAISSGVGIIGNHEGADNGSCSTSGWAFDENDTSTSIPIIFFMDGSAATGEFMREDVVANISRPDVNADHGITGNHGFVATFDSSNTPPSIMSALQTGTHQIYVYGDGLLGAALITDTPKSLNCSPPSTSTLTVNSSGASAVAITASPSTYGGTTNYTKSNIAPNTTITLTASGTIGSNSLSWAGCNSTSGNSCTVTMSSNKTVTANYSLNYVLTVNSSGVSGVAILGSSKLGGDQDIPDTYGGITNYTHANVPPGSNIFLTAPPTSGGQSFSNWTGCSSAIGELCAILSMAGSETVTANYITLSYTLTTSISSGLGFISGVGILCPGDCSKSYSSGEWVSLTATPLSSPSDSDVVTVYEFAGWSGACAGQTSSCSIKMDSNLSTAASFSVVGGETVDGSCGPAVGDTVSPEPTGAEACSTGIYNGGIPPDTSTEWRWTCVGLGGGFSPSCSANKPADSGSSLEVKCLVDLTTVFIGETVTWTAVVTGGAPASYFWKGPGLPVPAPTTRSFEMSYSTIGQKTATVTVTDADGQVTCEPGTEAGTVQVNFDPSFEEF